MADYRPLDARRIADAIPLYREMIALNAPHDGRLAGIDPSDASLRSLLGFSLDPGEDLFLLAYEGGRAVGFVDCSRIRREGGGEGWFIKSVFLEAGERGIDAFAGLVAELEERVRVLGGRELSCAALLGDPVADALWAACGYARDGMRRVKDLSA
jgi:hypothetical protein